MKKLSKEKRLQLVLVALATGGAIAGLWFGLITMQTDKLQEIANKRAGLQHELEKMQKVVKDAGEVELSLNVATNRLAAIESGMPLASGDLYSWIVSSIKQFNVP